MADTATTLEKELGERAELLLAKLLECWKTKQGSPTGLVFDALVDTYIQGANHKSQDLLPRVLRGSGWHGGATMHVDGVRPVTTLTSLQFADLMATAEPLHETKLQKPVDGDNSTG